MIKWEFLGRLHPLILHLPIGLIFGLLLIEAMSVFIDRGARAWRVCRRAYITLLAVSCVAAAATGYILSLEGQSQGVILTRHKWLGMAAAGLSLALLILAAKCKPPSGGYLRAALRVLVMWGLFAVIVVTGHFGGQLTHGPRFLSLYAPPELQAWLGPVSQESPEPGPVETATVYGALIQPILENHCAYCHGADQQKAQFAVHTPDALTAGGRSGPAIQPGNPLESEFVKRILLPVDEAGRMPPQGKSQLSSAQISAIQWWIEQGASFDAGLNPNDVPRELSGLLGQMETAEQPGPANMPAQWDEGLVRRLMDRQISIQRIQQADPRLWISFAAITDQVTDDTVKQLMPLAPFIAWLDLSNTRITSDALQWIAQMPALTELNLRRTGVQAEALKQLVEHQGLERLNLSQVPLDDTVVDTLLKMPSLKRVYLWDSQVSQAGIQRLLAPRIEVIAEAVASDIISTEPNAPDKP